MEKTILYGNGLNLISPNAKKWVDLLNYIKKESIVFSNGKIPFSILYEQILIRRPITYSTIFDLELYIKNSIVKLLDVDLRNSVYSKLSEINVKNFITTNYDNTFLSYFQNSKIYEIQSNSAEKIYSIRRNFQVYNSTKNLVFKLWPIHGFINNHKSIMLGLDHYCGCIGKMGQYLKGTYHINQNSNNEKIEYKLEKNKYDEISWLELFFNSNVHIIGLELYFDETDIWWLIIRRARLKKDSHYKSLVSNKIIYYTNGINSEKSNLLESFSIEVVDLSINGKNKMDWEEFYLKVLDLISSS